MAIDRRKLRTRKALQKSLISLILEKGYDAVSVSEVTDRADLGRATFYLHFKDKDDLLVETINAIVQDFIKKISPFPILPLDRDHDVIIRQVFEFAQQNSDLFRVILRGHGMYTATLRLQSVIAGFIYTAVKNMLAEQGRHPEVPLEILSNFYAGALLNTIYWWLENDTGYSADEMAANYRKLVLMDRDSILGST
jgi:AcrR family transcriptional regulator